MTNNFDEDILDLVDKKKSNDNIDFDLKMVRGMTLTYFIYGLVYYFQLSAFLVPLPVAYYLLPIAAAVMYVRSASSYKSIVLLFIPILVLKDLWINVNPTVVEPLLFVAIIIWLVWGVFFLVLEDQKNLKYSKLAAVSQFLILLIMIPNHWLVFPAAILISLVLLTIFVRANLENTQATVVLRISFLIQMMYVMYLLQVVSNFQNS
jgi:hypothetical protein